MSGGANAKMIKEKKREGNQMETYFLFLLSNFFCDARKYKEMVEGLCKL